jgi:aryl-alcohol dehydrogenase-like predicted oxidoreductase
MNRREFLASSVAIAGAALARFPYPLYASGTRKLASDRIHLGPMKVELSRMAMGTGTNGYASSSNQTRQLGIRGLADLLQAAFDQGVTFWDSADAYGSHPHLKEALKRVPRDRVTILTKTHASTEQQARADLDRFRREIGTDYIDILLLHDMEDDNWPQRKRGAMATISEARQKGIVKTHGTSCHTLGALKAAAASPWVQVDLARINPARMAMDADPRTVVSVLRQMKAAGKGVIGMKILGAGGLSHRVDEALQYALALDCVDCFAIGVENRGQLQDLLRRIPAASTRG